MIFLPRRKDNNSNRDLGEPEKIENVVNKLLKKTYLVVDMILLFLG